MLFLPNYPSIPFPPIRIHPTSGPLVIVGVNGELCRIDSQSLEALEKHGQPFPSEITNSAICEELFVGTWVESELQQARMAAISLDSGFVCGIDKRELRFSGKNFEIDCSVKGSKWSHPLDSEPLGIISENGLICFSNYKRGIYCVDSDSYEIWRIPEITWPPMSGYSDSEMVRTIAIGTHPQKKGETCIWIWNIIGAWATLDWSDGSIISRGSISTKGEIDMVKSDNEGGWILGLASGEIVRLSGFDLLEETITGGPCHDALFSKGVWYIAGWRQDIQWSKNSVQHVARDELGVALYQHPRDGMLVLDNQGKWTSFGSNN